MSIKIWIPSYRARELEEMQTRCVRVFARRLTLVHEIGVYAAAGGGILEDRLEDGLKVRERLDLCHEIHQMRVLFCN